MPVCPGQAGAPEPQPVVAADLSREPVCGNGPDTHIQVAIVPAELGRVANARAHSTVIRGGQCAGSLRRSRESRERTPLMGEAGPCPASSSTSHRPRPASSGSLVVRSNLGEGPCIAACTLDEVVAEPDLAHPSAPRAPAFAPAAARHHHRGAQPLQRRACADERARLGGRPHAPRT